MKLRITSLDDFADTRSIIQRPSRNGADAYILYTDPLDESVTSASWEVEVFRRRGDVEDSPWESLSTQTFTLPLAVSDSWDTAIQPVESKELTDAMKRVFGGVTRWTGGPQPVRFNINYQPTVTEPFKDVAIGVTVDLLHDGEVARQLDLWWRGGPTRDYRVMNHEVPFEDVPTLMSIAPEDLEEHWRLRVRSVPELALRTGDTAKYWKGEFTIPIIPLTLRDNDVRPKPPGWWVEEKDLAEGETIAQ